VQRSEDVAELCREDIADSLLRNCASVLGDRR
jgi:hypothetical protein